MEVQIMAEAGATDNSLLILFTPQKNIILNIFVT